MANDLRWSQEQYDAYIRKRTALSDISAQREIGVGETVPIPIEPPVPRSKYGAHKTYVAFQFPESVAGHLRLNHVFDSKKEADYYAQLVIRRQIGEIEGLLLQVPYTLWAVNPMTKVVKSAGEWYADFEYQERIDNVWTPRTVDVKSPGTRTALYALKRKIIEINYNFEILEV